MNIVQISLNFYDIQKPMSKKLLFKIYHVSIKKQIWKNVKKMKLFIDFGNILFIMPSFLDFEILLSFHV